MSGGIIWMSGQIGIWTDSWILVDGGLSVCHWNIQDSVPQHKSIVSRGQSFWFKRGGAWFTRHGTMEAIELVWICLPPMDLFTALMGEVSLCGRLWEQHLSQGIGLCNGRAEYRICQAEIQACLHSCWQLMKKLLYTGTIICTKNNPQKWFIFSKNRQVLCYVSHDNQALNWLSCSAELEPGNKREASYSKHCLLLHFYITLLFLPLSFSSISHFIYFIPCPLLCSLQFFLSRSFLILYLITILSLWNSLPILLPLTSPPCHSIHLPSLSRICLENSYSSKILVSLWFMEVHAWLLVLRNQ